MTASKGRARYVLGMLLALAGLAGLLILPGLPSGRANASGKSAEPGQKTAGSSLDAERQSALERLYAQFKAGAPFSAEETLILRKFGEGAAVTELEADVVISRALYDFYLAGKDLSKEQEELFDRYSQFAARRSSDVADLKAQLYNKRVAAAAAAPPAAPQVAPSNDLCAGAEVIPGAGPFPIFTAVTADVTDATITGDPPAPSCQTCVSGQVSRSIWYRFTPSVSASYGISSCASDGTASTADDTVMAIYTSSTSACGGVFTQVPLACDDDGCVSEALQSIISDVQLNAGTTYFIVVWQCDNTAPTAGNTAVQLRVTRTLPPANDTCAAAIALSVNTPVSGTTVAANNDYQLTGATCFTGIGQISSSATGRDVVYTFTAPTTNLFSFKVTNYGVTGNLVMYATTSCPAATPGTPVNITCNNISGPAFAASNRGSGSSSEELMCLSLTAAQQVFIFVDDNVAPGTFPGSTFTIEASACTREIESNNTPATANNFGITGFGIEGSITPAGDVDFYTLGSPAAGSRIFALADSVASNTTDLDMRVTTSTDTLEFDDLNADILFGTLGPAIGGTPVPAGAGSVFLRVNHNSAASVAEPYRLYYKIQPPGANALPSCSSVTTSATSETEPNNTSAQANTAANLYFSGSLAGPAPSTDLDVFSFTVSAGQLVFLSLDADPCRDNTPINGKLELLDTNGSTVLVSVNDGGSTSTTTSGAGSLTANNPSSPAEALVFRVAASGTYFARVSIGTSSTGSIGAGDYLLSISVGGPTVARFANDLAGGASATIYNNGVSLRWRTGFEVDNLGFNIYREQGGRRVRVNPQMIAGSALMVGSNTALGAGKSYAWFDNGSADKGAQYWIESVDTNGESAWRGPIGVTQSVGKTLDPAQSLTLGQLGVSNSQASQTSRVERKAGVKTVTASGVSLQPVSMGQSAVKMSVKAEGFYRVTQPELIAAGFNPSADPRTIQLFVDGQEQAINVATRNGQFDSSASIEFYGVGIDSAVTVNHVYWLVSGSQPGLRIQQLPAPSNQSGQGSFLYSAELKQRTVYFSGLRNGEKENFFGAVLARDPVDQALTLQHVDASSTNGAMLEVALQGVTTSAHRVEVQINGARVGEVVFNGQDAGVGRLAIQQSALKEGVNVVRLTPQGGPSDISLVDYVRATYWHTFVADNNQLRFNASNRQTVSVDGFNSASIRVFDVTNLNAVQEIMGTIKPGKSGFGVSLVVPGSGLRTLVAIANEAADRVSNIAADLPSSWRQAGNAADLVIFTRRDFISALAPLKSQRESQGYKAAIVDIEDAYDEFSYGNKTPQAIKDFLAYARSNWKVAPRFVLLAGDASFDSKNYLGFGDNDFVPTRLIDTQTMETASDDWLTDFDGDGLGEMAVGRLPVRSSAEASSLAAKIVGYDRSGQPEGALLVADESSDGADFEFASRELGAAIPDGVKVDQINRSGDDAAAVKAKLISALGRGPQAVNYMGHANIDTWKGGLLTSEDVGSLNNGSNLSLFVMMSCLNAYFHDAQLDSLGEALIKAGNGGAIAVWASSGMTSPGDQSSMDMEMFRQLFGQNPSLTVGEIASRARAAARNSDVRRTWILLGDPTTRLK
jgi:peptidase C25-like protein